MPLNPRARLVLTNALLALVLAGCATAPHGTPEALAESDWARASRIEPTAPEARWTHQTFGNRKATRYSAVKHQGRAAVWAHSESGNSVLRLRLAPSGPARGTLRFSWFVDTLNHEVDLSDRNADDAVTRVVLSFDGDRERLSRRDHMVSELAQLVTGEPLPYATLMYVWDPKLPVGTVVANPSTQRIRKLVIESGPERLGRWLDYERDIEADFRHAFGEAPGALLGLGLMTDANNTETTAMAWYGPLSLAPSVRLTQQP